MSDLPGTLALTFLGAGLLCALVAGFRHRDRLMGIASEHNVDDVVATREPERWWTELRCTHGVPWIADCPECNSPVIEGRQP